jgi:hypothetical protein
MPIPSSQVLNKPSGSAKAPRQLPPISKGLAPKSHAELFAVNAASSDLRTNDILRQWDKGSRNQRVALLTQFIRVHKDSTAAEIEKGLGHGALLLFTHITAWLRLTYPLGYELSVQLSAIALFLQGQKFLTNFLEVGGIQTLTDVLMLPTAGNDRSDKDNCLLLLLHISNSGRVYREMICDGAGTDCIVKATLDETNDHTLELMAALYLSLGQGNPRKATLVHAGLLYIMLHGNDSAALCSATTLRSLQIAKEQHLKRSGGSEATLPIVGAESPSQTEALLEAFFHLLTKDNVKLRFEATELISIAAKNGALTLPVLGRCLDVLDDDRQSIHDDDDDIVVTVRVQRKQTACGRAILNVVLRPHTEDSLHRIFTFFDRRSGHLSLIKYFLLTETKDVGSLLDCGRAVQLLCRGLQGAVCIPGRYPTKCSKYVYDLVGAETYEKIVCDAMTDDLCHDLLRGVKARNEQTMLALPPRPSSQ